MDGCNDILSFEGMNKCLVHFRHICVTYELMQQLMFHFLMGRCAGTCSNQYHYDFISPQ